jgi:hypothetical protein
VYSRPRGRASTEPTKNAVPVVAQNAGAASQGELSAHKEGAAHQLRI